MPTGLFWFLRRCSALTRLAPLCLGVALIASGCSGDGPVGPPAAAAVAAVSVSGPTSLEEGKTGQFTATARDEQGNVLTGRNFIWQTSSDATATISGDGSTATVTAKAKGPVTVSATSEGKKGDAPVTVLAAPSIALAATTVSLTAQAGLGASNSLNVTNAGDVTLSGLSGIVTYASGQPNGWLTASLNSTTAPATLTLQASAAHLPAGTYNATVTIRSSVPAVAEKSIAVTFTVERAATGVSGIISSNTTWTKANSPYRLTADVQIAEGATLTIDPGVTVHGGNKTIRVFGGVLRAVGTASERIAFDTVSLGTGVEGRGRLSLEYITTRAVSIGLPVGSALRNSILESSGAGPVRSVNGDVYIERNVFRNATAGASADDGSMRVFVRNNVFVGARSNPDPMVSALTIRPGATVVIEFNSFLSTNTIAGGRNIAVWAGSYVQVSPDARNNFWNTTDPAVIQSMIYDRNDDLNLPSAVLYEPFLTAPHPDTPKP